MRKFVFYIHFGFFCTLAPAQVIPEYSVSGAGHFGFILPHHPDMRYLINAHVPGGEINFFLSPKNCRDENKCAYLLPERGLGLLFFDFGNPEELGQGISLSPYFNFKLNRSEKFRLML